MSDFFGSEIICLFRTEVLGTDSDNKSKRVKNHTVPSKLQSTSPCLGSNRPNDALIAVFRRITSKATQNYILERVVDARMSDRDSKIGDMMECERAGEKGHLAT